MLQFDPIKIVLKVWSTRWWGRTLVIAALVGTALLIFVAVIGERLIVKGALGGVTLPLWVAIIIAYLSISASEARELYRNALSLDQLNYGTKKAGIDFELILSNTLPDKSLAYEVALSKSYLEINGDKQTRPHEATKGAVIPPQKPTKFLLGMFKASRTYPYEAVLHYEIAYGLPNKLLFHQITELDLYISGPTYKQLTWTIGKQEVKPLASK
jgi:hypothetical protein